MRIVPFLHGGLLALAAPAAQAQPPAPLTFPNSGAPAAQASFLRGLSLLHNFEYPRAAEAFREAQAADPTFALAYWGEAMTYNHPVWMRQDAAAARGVLARLGPSPESRLARAPAGRERGLMEAVEILYGEGTKEERDRAYAGQMAGLGQAFPNDVDIQAFRALSLLGLAHDGRDVRLYMRAAALLEPLLPVHPDHPGVLHYLIHSYDDPTHAPLGLRAAHRYGDVAPDAPHARHMTSHIFLALGMWDEVIEANVAADAAVDALRRAAGRPAVACGHYNEWLYYALLQAGRGGDAQVLQTACWDQVRTQPGGIGAVFPSGAPVLSLTDMAIRGVIDSGEPLDRAFAAALSGAHPEARFTIAYAELLTIGANAGQVRAARQRLIEADRALREVPRTEPEPAYATRRRAIILDQAEGLEALRTGRTEAGLAALRRAAEAERTMPAEFGPPLVEKPSFELLGDELLRLRRVTDAVPVFRTALELAPGRQRSSRGLAAAEDSTPR
jgi:tetratricopeptide (TPR) repeat protein